MYMYIKQILFMIIVFKRIKYFCLRSDMSHDDVGETPSFFPEERIGCYGAEDIDIGIRTTG